MEHGLNSTPTVEVLYQIEALVAEGPFYEEETALLLWIDIDKRTINFLDPIKKTNRILEFPCAVAAVIPIEGTTRILALLERKICVVDRHSGSIVSELCSVEDDKPDHRFNDGKCDSSGRLWCGTMHTDPYRMNMEAGFYSYFNGKLHKQCDAILSNGIEWDLTETTMYHIDSNTSSVYSYSYDPQTGTASNRKVHIDYAKNKELGSPDGMCRDQKGRLWVAGFGSQRVVCWDPETKEIILTVVIPGAKDITSCCFGGPNFEWLFVTSGILEVPEEDLKAYPNSGALFVIKDLGTRGFPPHKFRLN